MKFRVLLCMSFLAVACSDPIVEPPRSLQGPVAFAASQGEVCLSQQEVARGVWEPFTRPCEADEFGSIGLVVNERIDRLAVFDLSVAQPRVVNFSSATPGVSHIKVGRLPIDVAASADGTVAYVLNQLDADISVIDMWTMQALDQRIGLDGTPIALAARPSADAELLVAQSSPSFVSVFAASRCEQGALGDVPNCTLHQEETGRISLPGTVTDIVFHPSGTHAYISYRERDYLSVIGLDPDFTAERGCLDGTSAPCVTGHIGMTFECSDGLDNDGDGNVDQQDPQCYSPFGAESPGGIGRTFVGECADGIDNDGSGLIDREDPSCTHPSGQEGAIVEIPVTACNDGVDNDGDGFVDYPADPDCYGPYGRSESPITALGLDSLGIDPRGFFLYATDRARSQVLVVDATRDRLIDAVAAAEPDGLGFSNQLGISVSSRPTSVAGHILEVSDDASGLVRFDFGAFVTLDNGFIQYIESMVIICQPGADLEECYLLPELPLDQGEADELQWRDFVQGEAVLTVNPRFSPRDAQGQQGRIIGRGSCEQPETLLERMRNAGQIRPDLAQSFRCDSALMPQPLATFEFQENAVREVARAGLITRETLLLPTDQANRISSTTFDHRLRDERWTISYEGILPGTRREDGWTVDADGLFDLGGADVCAADVREGDLLLIRTLPLERCADLEGGSEFMTYRIQEILPSSSGPDSVVLETIEGFAPLPRPECFETGISFEIRAADQWIAVGERSGFISPTERRFSACVPKFGSDRGQMSARVDTGGFYTGPYLSFYLWPGPVNDEGDALVNPARGTVFTFQVERNFQPDRFNTTGLIPQSLQIISTPQRRQFLVAVDPAQNFAYFRNINQRNAPGILRR